jgi:hypothetical protein
MTVKLDKKWVDYLVRQPESGMGFQKVDVRLKGNRVLNDVFVFNAEEIDLPADCAGTAIEELHLHKD